MSEEVRSTYKDRKSKEKIAIITGACMIIATVIGTVSISININIEIDKLKEDYKELKIENSNLQIQLNDMSDTCKELKVENSNLRNEILELQSQLAEKDLVNNNNNIYIKIKVRGTPVRSSPQISAHIITVFNPGEILLVDDVVTASDERKWYQVLVEDQIGFIHSGLAEIIE